VSDIIRKAREAYGPAYDQMAAEAGQIKEQYVAEGGNPEDVYSFERLEALARGGPQALENMPPQMREDGSVAGPYVPTEMALQEGMIEEAALPSVLLALMDGVETVSSGTDACGNGFAVGRAPNGQAVKVQA
jgi:hypothetical protein